MKNRTGPTINGKLWDRIESTNGSIATTCKKKKGSSDFSSSALKIEDHENDKKNEAFWRMDVKTAGLWKSVRPCVFGRGRITRISGEI